MKCIDKKRNIFTLDKNYGHKIKICPYCDSNTECTGGSVTGGIAYHCKLCGACFNSTRCNNNDNKYDGWILFK